MKRFLIAGLLILGVTSDAGAQSSVTASQGPSSSSYEWNMNHAARRGGKTTEKCVTNAAGGTDVTTSATALAGRKAVELQNLGPNAIFCTVDGQAPLATGALGRRIDASGGVWSIDAGPLVRVRCIAATALQATPACTMVTELR